MMDRGRRRNRKVGAMEWTSRWREAYVAMGAYGSIHLDGGAPKPETEGKENILIQIIGWLLLKSEFQTHALL